jgi:hypothetical protein
MKNFFKQLFNPAGTVSFGRVMSLLLSAFVLGWDTSYVKHTHQLPPGSELLLQAGFMASFYGITKGVELKNPPGVQ